MTLPSWTPYPGHTKLSLKQIRDEFGCTIIVPTPEIEIPRPPLSPPLYPPLPISIGSFTVTPTSFDETSNKIGTVTYSIANRRGLTLYAFVYHITTNAADFDGDTKWTITADSGSFTFTIKTDNITELSTEKFQIVFSVDETYDGAFYTSAELGILDTSTYPRYNPRILPVADATGSYITTTNTPITINVADAPPNSTFTSMKTFKPFDNFTVAAPWTPNPFITTTPQTIGADGKWTDSTYTYTVPGEYEYVFYFDNYSPSIIENGPNRTYKVTVNLTLGNWKLYPTTTSVIGGQANFTFKYEAPDVTDLKQLSWFVVNPGTTTNYSGAGIVTLGAAFNITRDNETNRIGEFTIRTSSVSADQDFEVVLFSGELNQSTKLIQSVTCKVQVKPIIPDLLVTPASTRKFYKETNQFIVSGSPNEVVEFVYVNPNAGNTNYVHYFDYYYDVQHAYETNKFGDASGKTAAQYAEYHYTNAGSREGRLNSAALKASEDKIIKSTVTLLASQSTIPGRGNAIVDFATVSFADEMRPRQTVYKFSFVGDKAENTKTSPLVRETTIFNEPRLFVSGPATVPFGSAINVTTWSSVGQAKVTYRGPTTGEANNDAAGYLVVNVGVGGTLSTNTLLKWYFNAEGVTRDRDVEYTCTIVETGLSVVNKTSLPGWKSSTFENTANNRSYTITVILGDDKKISLQNVVWAVRSTQTNSTGTLKKNNDAPVEIQFDAGGDWPMFYELGTVREPGQDVLEITTSTSTTKLTITINYILINEVFEVGLVGGPYERKPSVEYNPGTQVQFVLTGGYKLSPVQCSWVHDPSPNATTLDPTPGSDIITKTTDLNENGGWATTDSKYTTTWTQPGTYAVIAEFAATGNRRTAIVKFKRVYPYTVILEKTNAITASYFNDETMYARITGNPGEVINISSPMYYPSIPMYGCTKISIPNQSSPTTFRGVKKPFLHSEGMDARNLIAPYPGALMSAAEAEIWYLEINTDVKNDAYYKTRPREHYDTFGRNEGRMWPTYIGFPIRTVTLDANGEGRINLNGDFNRVIEVASSHYNRTTDPATSYMIVAGVRYNCGGRGHTMRTFDPNTLAVKFQKTYDTYGLTYIERSSDPDYSDPDPVQIRSFINDLKAIPAGDLVIINSFDAINMSWELNSIIIEILGRPPGMDNNAINRYWTWLTPSVGTARANQITIGYARQPDRLIYWTVEREQGIINYSYSLPGAANQYPFLAALNKPQFDPDESVAELWWKHPHLDAYSPSQSQQFPYRGRSKYNVSGGYKYKFVVRNSAGTPVTLSLDITRADGNEVIRKANLLDPATNGTLNNICPSPEADPYPYPVAGDPSTGDFYSDAQLKSNIIQIGTHQLGFGIYEYDIFDRREQGVLAQEVQTILPQAVTCGTDGYLRVRYDLIGYQRTVISKH